MEMEIEIGIKMEIGREKEMEMDFRVGASWRPRANKSVSWGRLGLILGGFLVDF